MIERIRANNLLRRARTAHKYPASAPHGPKTRSLLCWRNCARKQDAPELSLRIEEACPWRNIVALYACKLWLPALWC
jgi:hypothetical protein